MPEYIEKGAAIYAVDCAMDLFDTEYDMVCDAIDNAPAADVAPVRHGKWIIGKVNPGCFTPGGNSPWICSECGKVISWMLGIPQENYCPNCGAKMDLEVNHD